MARAHEAQRAAGRVERAVAEELLELQQVPLGDGVELALEEQHLPVRAHLLLAAAAADVAERLREGGDVVDHPEAVHHRIDARRSGRNPSAAWSASRPCARCGESAETICPSGSVVIQVMPRRS